MGGAGVWEEKKQQGVAGAMGGAGGEAGGEVSH